MAVTVLEESRRDLSMQEHVCRLYADTIRDLSIQGFWYLHIGRTAAFWTPWLVVRSSVARAELRAWTPTFPSVTYSL
jgi:hypothetical protein